MTACKLNTDCSQLCLLTPAGAQCACSDGYELSADNVSCTGKGKPLNFSSNQSLLKVGTSTFLLSLFPFPQYSPISSLISLKFHYPNFLLFYRYYYYYFFGTPSLCIVLRPPRRGTRLAQWISARIPPT